LDENTTQKEIDMLAATNPQIKQAIADLVRLSADTNVRLAYERRERVIRDEISRIDASKAEGIEIGRREGKEEGIGIGGDRKLISLIDKKLAKGKTRSEIIDELEMGDDDIKVLDKHLADVSQGAQ
jgi:predicted transposase YdaD